jgi:hypothetical protein
MVLPLISLSFVLNDPSGAPRRAWAEAAAGFSAADRAVIERNEMLRSIVDVEPALVRRVLDALARIDTVQTRSELRQERPRATRRPVAAERPFDEAKNPDLDRLDRSSPEAMNDLFQLLKQAASRPRPSR